MKPWGLLRECFGKVHLTAFVGDWTDNNIWERHVKRSNKCWKACTKPAVCRWIGSKTFIARGLYDFSLRYEIYWGLLNRVFSVSSLLCYKRQYLLLCGFIVLCLRRFRIREFNLWAVWEVFHLGNLFSEFSRELEEFVLRSLNVLGDTNREVSIGL